MFQELIESKDCAQFAHLEPSMTKELKIVSQFVEKMGFSLIINVFVSKDSTELMDIALSVLQAQFTMKIIKSADCHVETMSFTRYNKRNVIAFQDIILSMDDVTNASE